MRKKIAAVVLFATLGCSGGGDQPAARPPAAPPAPPVQPDNRGVILFLGTSLTAGYGVGVEHAYPAVIQEKLDSAAYPFKVTNAGLSGETSAGGLRRLDWSLQQPVDVLVLELGANDGLRGLPVTEMRANLDTIIARTKRHYPDAQILIAGMEAPPNLGRAYTEGFRTTYSYLSRKYDAVLIPFLLDRVAAHPELNQEDGIHPNIEGHKLVAESVWQKLEPMLEKRRRVVPSSPRHIITFRRAPAARA